VEAEYLYTDYGAFTEAPIAVTPFVTDSARVHIRDNQIMAGFSYKFDWAQPVVSKY
jgi:hypothetical protein